MAKKFKENQVERLPVEMITTDEEYDKLDPKDPEIQSRARSIVRDRQLQPILVNQDLKIVDGRKRLLATKVAGLPNIDVYVKYFESESREKIAELIANFERSHFTSWELQDIDENLKELYAKEGIPYQTRGVSDATLAENPTTEVIRISGKSKTRFYTEKKIWTNLDPRIQQRVKELDLSVVRAKDISMMSADEQNVVADMLDDPKTHYEWMKLFQERSPELARRVRDILRPQEPVKEPAKKIKKEVPKIDNRDPFNRNQLGNLTRFLQTAPFPDSRQGWLIGVRIAVNEKKKYFRIIFQLDANTKLTKEQEKSLKHLHGLFKDIKGYKGCYTIEPVSFDPQDGYWVNETEKITPKDKNAFFACTSKHKSLF